LPTLAGWWRARDLAWRAKISSGFDAASAQRSRERDREHLWRAFTQAHCAKGPKPPEIEKQVVLDSAIAFIGKTASKLALVPIEDIAGEVEQPNLPGTVEEHPNWRRRLPSGNGLGSSRVRRRLGLIARARPRP
jgi:4-alpha-glucanotransferase